MVPLMAASRVLRNSVTGSDEDGWDFQCPVTDGTCGNQAEKVPFSSTGWPTRAFAEERGQQHFDEHNGEGAMQELHDFRQERGITQVSDDGARAFTADMLPKRSDK